MLENAYCLAKTCADTAENEPHFAKKLTNSFSTLACSKRNAPRTSRPGLESIFGANEFKENDTHE
jgi:hypothetical protein